MYKVNKFNGSFNIIGSKIKKIRKENKITQEDLCARLQILGYNINRSDISKIENGKKFVADFEVLGFSRALRVSLLDLYFLGRRRRKKFLLWWILNFFTIFSLFFEF